MSKYAGYSVRIAQTDSRAHVKYLDDAATGELLRVHYVVCRVPSRREFVIRHYHDATPEDRARIVRPENVARVFEYWESIGAAHKRRASKGYYWWGAAGGHLVDDPMVQLELEMMIDRGSGVSGALPT